MVEKENKIETKIKEECIENNVERCCNEKFVSPKSCCGYPKEKSTTVLEQDDIKRNVRESYGKVAMGQKSCCAEDSERLGYSKEELNSIPLEADMGLGCGSPNNIAGLSENEIVIDLGSGGGIDCFIASKRVGNSGKVIGVDMTPEMIYLARKNAKNGNFTNVEFRLGELEYLPIEANFADVVISNCVINLVPDKLRAFEEAFRVLKTSGRIIVSDIIRYADLPDEILKSPELYNSCLSGASLKEDYLKLIETAGFRAIQVLEEKKQKYENYDVELGSITVRAIK